jgi:hypothetical protein
VAWLIDAQDATEPILWDRLTRAERCVLLAAAESALLIDLVSLWHPADWDKESPLPYVAQLAPAVVSLAEKGLIVVHQDDNEDPIPLDRLPGLIMDERTWWNEDAPGGYFELGTTGAARGVFATASNVYDWR